MNDLVSLMRGISLNVTNGQGYVARPRRGFMVRQPYIKSDNLCETMFHLI